MQQEQKMMRKIYPQFQAIYSEEAYYISGDSESDAGAESPNLVVMEKKRKKGKGKEQRKEKCPSRKRSQGYNTDAIDITDVIEIEQDAVKEEFKEPIDPRQEPKRQMMSKMAKLRYSSEYEAMSTLKKMAVELLDDIEYVRVKSQRIQGKYSGIIKDRIFGLKEYNSLPN